VPSSRSQKVRKKASGGGTGERRTTPVGRRGRQKLWGPRGSARARLLDAAEELFGAGTYREVTIRDIARLAAAPLGVATYHFPSKEDLFREVLSRRLDEHVAGMRTGLEKLLAKSGDIAPSAEQIIKVLLDSILERAAQSREWTNYVRVIARATTSVDREPFMAAYNQKLLPVALAYYSALRRAFPQATDEALLVSFNFLIAIVVFAILQNDSVGFDLGADRSRLAALVPPFAAAGFFRMAELRQSPLGKP